jgi:hypothetical protein
MRGVFHELGIDYDHVVEASSAAWNKLIAEHGRIASIGTRGWTAISQGP